MNKKQKIIIGVVSLGLIGAGIWWWKNKGVGSSSVSSETDTKTGKTQTCLSVKESSGGGKGKFLSVKGGKGSTDRKTLNSLSVGQKVSVDGVETTITKFWKDKNGDNGAVRLKNGVANGSKMCW